MFLIEAEEEIRKNISFFNKVIRLHQKNKVAIFIYQRWYEKLKRKCLFNRFQFQH